MKNHEIIEVLECCVREDCKNCPYKNNEDGCMAITAAALDLIKEQKAKLDNLLAPTAMPNYETMYYDLQREKTRVMTENAVMGEELAFLRAVKATAEAFLGREIK